MNKYQSPLITRFLDYILPSDLHHLVGDMEEEFHQNKEYYGRARAYLYLWSQVFRTLPWFIFQSLIWNTVMITNYLKVTWRTIKKHTSFSLINIMGLATSMAICLLILLFIIDQRSYDRFHEKSDRIYRIDSFYKAPSNNSPFLYATTPADLAEEMESNYPSVEEAVHIRAGFNGELRIGAKTYTLQGLYTEADFFTLFDFELIKGNPKTALNDPGNIILTKKSSTRLFGEADPMGKTITGLGDRDYVVTGIVDSNVKTHFHFEALVSYSTLTTDSESSERLSNWKESIYDSYTYILLKQNTPIESLKDQFPDLIDRHYQDPEKESVISSFEPQHLTKINLGPNISNEIGMVIPGIIAWFLAGFGLIIILIACFNYLSLTVARAINRGKEVGVRKVLGAFRSNIIKQFLTESIIIAVLALVIAILILQWLLPQFNSLFIINFTQNQVQLDFLSDYWIYIPFFLFSVFIGILAGIYPALYLSSFQPSKVLKGITNIRGLSAKFLRKTITVTQFTFSIVFIITTVVLIKQFNFMVNTDYGFNKEHIINVALQDVPYQRFAEKFDSHSEVASIAASSKVPALGSISGAWMKTDSLAERIRGHYFGVNEHYIQTMGLNLLAGRNFNVAMSSDLSESVIISRSAVEELGLGSTAEAVGKPVEINEKPHTVIGVIDDFISADPMRKGDPIFLRYDPENFYYAVVKVKPGGSRNFLDYLDTSWVELESVYSLKYQVFDEQLKENPIIVIFGDFLKVLGLIATFSIFISCLGLLGMAMYAAENRVKEIGIRKVLGASVNDIVYLLSKEYLVLITIAILLGSPLAWFINNLWLQQVSNKISIGPLIFVLGIAGTVLLALLTISSQTIRAARAKSVENLQSE